LEKHFALPGTFYLKGRDENVSEGKRPYADQPESRFSMAGVKLQTITR
jgi:hypothetical protein